MGQNEIYSWIAKARTAGFSDTQITAQLKTSGWTDAQIVQLLGVQPSSSGFSQSATITRPQTLNEQPKKVKRHTGLIIGIIVAVVVLAVGGVTFAAWKGYVTVPILSPYFSSLESEALEKAFKNMTTVRGQEVTIDLSLAGEPRTGGSGQALPNGESSNQWFGMIPADTKVSVQMTVFAKNTTDVKTFDDITKTEALMSLNASYQSGGTTLSGKGELRMKDGTMYVRMSDLPNLGLIDFSSFNNTWYSIVIADILAENPLTNVAVTNSSVEQTQEWQSELSALYRIARETDFVGIEKVGKEDVAGVATTKYAITLHPDTMSKFIDAYREDAKKRNATIKEIDELLAEMLTPDSVAEMKNFLNISTMHVWVTGDPYIAKLAIETVIVPPDDITELKDRQMRLSMGMSFGKFNQQPVVEVPTDAQDLKELLGGARQEARDDTRKNDLRILKTALLIYYDQNSNTYPKSLDVLSPEYTNTIPKDPETDADYQYAVEATGAGFEVCATLDDGSPYCIRFLDGVVTETPDTNAADSEILNIDDILNSNVSDSSSN